MQGGDSLFFMKEKNKMASPKDIRIEEFQYPLPDERIAKHPLAQRDSCKLLVADANGNIQDRIFSDLPEMLGSDDMLIYNNTRVINARLRFTKPTGGIIEVFCLEPVYPADYEQCFASTGPVEWRCFVGNSKRWKEGPLQGVLDIDGKEVVLTAERVSLGQGDSVVRLSWSDSSMTFARIIEAAGEIPIPPYLNRSTEPSDLSDYQTVFSHIEGSVAAPTAGLHFTEDLLAEIDKAGAIRREVTLHVGAGTFQPVKSEKIGDHPMHSEFIVVSRDLIAELATSERRVTAVGTTSVRTLESLYHIGCLIAQDRWNGNVEQWYPYSEDHPNLDTRESLKQIVDWLDAEGLDKLVASTRIIIAPGYRYRIVRRMITNFHQPGSTLLLLVSAFIGDIWKKVYEHALASDYRFLSYGDACLFSISDDEKQ